MFIRRTAVAATIVAVVLAGVAALAEEPSPEDYYFKGEAALKHADCPAAVESLEKVTGKLREDARWLRLAAKAQDCAGKLEKSRGYWLKLKTLSPADAEIRREIADIEYRIERDAKTAAETRATEDRAERRKSCGERCKTTTEGCAKEARDVAHNWYLDVSGDDFYENVRKRDAAYDASIAQCETANRACTVACDKLFPR